MKGSTKKVATIKNIRRRIFGEIIGKLRLVLRRTIAFFTILFIFWLVYIYVTFRKSDISKIYSYQINLRNGRLKNEIVSRTHD